ncbi:CPBP family intramembrane glutamic endopeptidase [Spirosoma liriopis]|uniref:CPBP family intramembrane glutamic endopeptidase n=1 Tax=Spirosoma liriopis TaxID=2937440 RepID=UPI00338FE686
MSLKLFTKILLVNIIIVIIMNICFYFEFFKVLLSNYIISILLGLLFLCLQFAIVLYILKKNKFWLTDPFQKKSILKGIALTGIIHIIIYLLSVFFSNGILNKNIHIKSTYFFTFIFNSLPNALSEEWLYRYLPLRYSKQFSKKSKTFLVIVITLLIFTIIHIPSYIFQYNISLNQLYIVLANGIFFWFIYLSTKNLSFTVICHSLTNLPFNIYNLNYYMTYFYIAVTFTCIIWYVLRKR